MCPPVFQASKIQLSKKIIIIKLSLLLIFADSESCITEVFLFLFSKRAVLSVFGIYRSLESKLKFWNFSFFGSTRCNKKDNDFSSSHYHITNQKGSIKLCKKFSGKGGKCGLEVLELSTLKNFHVIKITHNSKRFNSRFKPH